MQGLYIELSMHMTNTQCEFGFGISHNSDYSTKSLQIVWGYLSKKLGNVNWLLKVHTHTNWLQINNTVDYKLVPL